MRSITNAALPGLIALACATASCFAADAGTNAADRTPFAQREIAAHRTANKAAACVAAQPFYWEIGNKERLLANGQAGEQGQPIPDAHTQLALASASKWLYGAYVAERRQGHLTKEDASFLNFTSGYTRFHVCLPNQTVADCQSSLINGLGRIDKATQDLFDYNGGHMQKHATLMGLGPLDKAGLASAIKLGLRAIGPDWNLSYSQAQLAGGGVSTADDYSRFLRAVLQGDLKIASLLGANAVCTNPLTCPNEAVKAPIPSSETWHYAVGHWVEDDPVVGDGAFSSPGAFGFYPWIDASKTFYGVLAREDRTRTSTTQDKPAVQSVDCGRLIRKAWLTGEAQP